MPQVGNLDSKLPFTKESLNEILNGQRPSVILEFEHVQWEVFPPFFQKERNRRVFREETIIPFAEKLELGEGGFGTVYNVSIPEGQHGFGSQFGNPVRRLFPEFEVLI